MDIKLLVLRTSDQKKLSNFYSLLGFTFEYHKHGNSPMHYSASTGNFVLEIYPLAKNQISVENHLRLGFSINNFEETLYKLEQNNIAFLPPVQTEFGFLTIITDPDGRKIEIYKK